MIPGKNCLDLIKSFEGLSLKAYNDPASGGLPITIGYGSTYKADGTKFKLGDTITEPQASSILQFVVTEKSKAVNTLLAGTGVTQNQFDALVDFAYNLGSGNLATSTLLKKVKANPNDTTIAAWFMVWNKGGGKVIDGLTRRRAAEVKLYFTK